LSSWLLCLLSASRCFFIVLLFDPENEGDISSETLADFHQSAWHYIPEDRTLSKHKLCKIPRDFHSLYALNLNKPCRLLSYLLRWHKNWMEHCLWSVMKQGPGVTILSYELSLGEPACASPSGNNRHPHF
jgi:hypothetical protein